VGLGEVALDPQLRAGYLAFVRDHPKNHHTPRLLGLLFEAALLSGDEAQLSAVRELAAEHYSGTLLTQQMKARLRRRDAVGAPFPLRFKPDGPPAIESEFVQGRPVAIVVWTSHSATASAVLDTFRKNKEDAAVIVVNLDANQAEFRRRYRNEAGNLPAHWQHVHLPRAWAAWFVRRWDVRQAPTVFVLDRDRRLVGVAGADGYAALLAEAASASRSSGQSVDNKGSSAD
jgi:hypothetical protein